MLTDKIALSVLMAAGTAAGYGWIDTANGIATLVVTIIAGIGAVGAALYHYEGWRQRRKERTKK